MMLRSLREQVASHARALAEAGLVLGTAGNISARQGDLVAVTPTGARLADLRAEHVTVVDQDGGVVEGTLAPTSELDLHLGVYRRFRAGAVVHTHAPMATALSLVVDELPCVHYQLVELGGTVPVAPYRTFGTTELADAVLEALDGRTAALMANHGGITFGADLATAAHRALLLEWGCELYWRASLLGKPRTLDRTERADYERQVARLRYGVTRELD
ncbi:MULTISPECIES: class II aldolase/adducin family protein [Actinokineospora]|uniref:L-fuculose 1-phosphate aldolase n=2 Tax=Actinokineospora TaxID=39845 RepID=A0A421BB93_9PSEU|nr:MULTISPECIES: class II aldolase/adducin family protein [Actinokineospora]RLK61625.1 L-fuculose 1-phosphate aldolase [Actinokineospora cianjurensis]SES31038.1 L-fuculose-phosphate aldolase [Actinokineospora terrae]